VEQGQVVILAQRVNKSEKEDNVIELGAAKPCLLKRNQRKSE